MAAKLRTSWVCHHCGAEHAQWLGQCPVCKQWNTLVEEVRERPEQRRGIPSGNREQRPVAIAEISAADGPRITLGDRELDRVLGGGVVPGSLILIGGDPGIGKSTLMLQTALRTPQLSTLYVSGEESAAQVRMRADRLGGEPGATGGTTCFVLTETNTQNIFRQAQELQPGLVIVDSVQTLHTAVLDGSPGTVGQVRECTGELMRFAKATGIPVVLIGHITKDGAIAGPKVLEHMVDCVLQFEGDRNH
ncbi:MAG TPA: AAA family ATPase, partial [Flavobacteriales bacterium]|nr:AAA family ATPase [Flavobacteriales bacterium]